MSYKYVDIINLDGKYYSLQALIKSNLQGFDKAFNKWHMGFQECSG